MGENLEGVTVFGRRKSQGSDGAMTVVNRNSKADPNSELRRFIEKLLLDGGSSVWLYVNAPLERLGCLKSLSDDRIYELIPAPQVMRGPFLWIC